jgi:hypothetical protein
MKNVHLLPTDKPSKLSILNNGKLNFGAEIMSSSNSKLQHIYITSSDEEIKEGDWVISNYGELIKISYKGSKVKENVNEFCKKIILTTDQDLIKDGVQPIDDEFLEWFVKNSSCEFVEVDKNWNYPLDKRWEYKIIIPQEELKHPKVFSENGNELFFDEQGNLGREQLDYTALLQPVGTRQETLEEAAEKFTQIWFQNNDFTKELFIKGAKWQQERMYSKEEVIAIVEKSRETGLTAEYLLLTDQFKKK